MSSVNDFSKESQLSRSPGNRKKKTSKEQGNDFEKTVAKAFGGKRNHQGRAGRGEARQATTCRWSLNTGTLTPKRRRVLSVINIEFTFYGEPVAFKRPRAHGKFHFNDHRYANYKKAFSSAILASNHQHLKDIPAPKTKDRSRYLNFNRYKLQVRAYCSHDRSDTDNLGKVVMDALQDSGLIADDRQIIKLTVEKFIDKINPRIAFRLVQTQSWEQLNMELGG